MISLTIHLDVAFPKWKRAFKKMEEKIERAAAAAFVDAKKPPAFTSRNFEMNIVLADDRAIKTLNRDYRGMDKPTNVLSFPQFDLRRLKTDAFARHPSPSPIPLGDVVLAWQTLGRECKEQNKSLENHTVHLVVHGTLHLLGYDHMSAKDAKSMEKLECDILGSMGYPDPYHDSQP
jgi:probable rRNA maturation factor